MCCFDGLGLDSSHVPLNKRLVAGLLILWACKTLSGVMGQLSISCWETMMVYSELLGYPILAGVSLAVSSALISCFVNKALLPDAVCTKDEGLEY